MTAHPLSFDRRPLAPHQLGIHLADSLAERADLHTVITAYRLTGSYNAELLRERFRALVRRHPALSSRITEDGPEPTMARSDADPEWRDEPLPAGTDDEDAVRRLLDDGLGTLDTRRGPLIKGALLRRPDSTADLVLSASHLAVDDQSMQTVITELLTGDATTPSGDYTSWATAAAEAARRGADRAEQLRARLAALPLAPVPEFGCGDGDAAEADGGQVAFVIPRDTWHRLTATARALGVTPYSTVTAAAGLVYARNSGTEVALVGAFVNRRPARERHTVGYFGSTVPVPVRATEEETVAEFLRASHRRALAAYRDADLPLFDVLPADLHGPGSGALHVAVAPYWKPSEIRLPDLTAAPHPHPHLGAVKFPLLCYIDFEADGDGDVRGLLQFRHRWFTPETAALFARQTAAVLRDFAERPEAPLGTVTTLAEEDHRRVLATARGKALDTAEALSIPALFARSASRFPHRVAVNDEKAALTYAELDERSDALARALAEAGVAPGDRVGVQMERSCDLVVTLLAVLKAGAAYTPLDPAYPEARLAFMTEDADLRAVVGDPSARPAASVPWLSAHATPDDPAAPLPAIDPAAPCYVIYTSGSTGRPKGVLVAHRNVTALLAATRDSFSLAPSDVWTFFHSFAFDFSVWEIWGCLLTGGRLVVVPHAVSRNPEEFHRLLDEEEVTVLSQTPTAFGLLLATEGITRGSLAVRLVVFGGEPLDTRALTPWFERFPGTRLENMYGITETTVHCTSHTVNPEDAHSGGRSVGRPLPGWELYVLDTQGRPVAPGIAGEIHVGGAGVSLGYLDRPDLTADRFTRDRHPDVPGRRLYRSGDRGRYLPNGELEHLGRLDAQVKVRGFRIELGEVRNVLLEDPAVTSAAVVVHGTGTAEARLDAYVVLAPGESTTGVRQRAAARLPEHMVPETMTALPAFPLTANGKLDTEALPEPAPAVDMTGTGPSGMASSGNASAGAADEALDEVVAVWREVLKAPVTGDDNFFALGGTSMLALRLKARLREAGLPDLALKEIVRHPTPVAMAALIRSRTATDREEAR
ncbi:amino acid adenylation domain-containing protein [Streptomyces hirsutus]|uniref:non-ribosomal peptide synthetase n=1 Tax=Streptomyces hirsutus TaxID=35620 RepID=UPI00386BAAEB|nr:amino acid adenylation domain-containing protein [Streptomyces hirsutus]